MTSLCYCDGRNESEFKNALKDLCGADSSVATKCGTMDTTAATKVSKSDWLKRVCQEEGEHTCSVPHTFPKTLLELPPFRSWWLSSRLFGCPHTLQLACHPKQLQAITASATKQNILMSLGGSLSPLPCHFLTPQTAARRAHSTCMGNRLQQQHAEGARSPACKFPKAETRFCNQRNSMFLNKAASTCSCMTCG